MMSKLSESPIFICGHPKAGTSLVRNLLDSHPQLLVFPEETTFFRQLYPQIKSLDQAEAQDAAVAHLTRYLEWNLENPPEHQAGFPDRDYSQVDDRQVKARMRTHLEAGIRHPGSYLTATARALAETLGMEEIDEKRWVEKTPYNERFASLIFSWWPDTRCVHVVRDPSDNYASYSRKQRHWQAGFFANSWVRSISTGFANQEAYGKDRYLILRYEDLVQNLDVTLAELCAFLAVDYDDSLKIPTRLGESWGGNSMFNANFQAVSDSPVGRWQTELTSSEAAQIQLIARKYIRRLGYAADAPRSIADFFKAVSWQARSALYALRHPGREEEV